MPSWEEGGDCSDDVCRGHAHSPVRNSSGLKIEEIVDYAKSTNEKRVKKKKSHGQKSQNKSADEQLATWNVFQVLDSVGMEESPVAEAGNDLNPCSEKKKGKKKKKQNKLQENAPTLSSEKKVADKNESDLEKKERGGAAKSLNLTTPPNELIIQDLDMGRHDGRIASKNKKVFVRYTGRLWESNKIFASNIGLPLFRFRLGLGHFLKGWDIGIDGMRVVGKRKLIIPPDMGYGAKGSPPLIPPNSCLVYEVHLLKVTK